MCRNHGVSDVFSNSAESSLGPSALEDGTGSEESFIKLFFQWLTSSVQIRPRFEKKGVGGRIRYGKTSCEFSSSGVATWSCFP